LIAPLAGSPAPGLRAVAARRPAPLLAGEDLRAVCERVVATVVPGAQVEERLAAAARDAAATPGSLWRAQLAFAVATACGIDRDAALDLATGVEAFHTASLIFDDLPSMDAGRFRRGRPCLHLVHGEAAATLVALAYVHRGHALLWRAMGSARSANREDAARLVEECLGTAGVLDGQARDLHWRERASVAAEAEVLRVARGKTVALLRLALVLPARLAGSEAPTVAALEELADSWGLGYQMLDDLDDDESGDADRRLGRPNFGHAVGVPRALGRLDSELRRSVAAVEELSTRLEGALGCFLRLQFRLAGARRALERRREHSRS
jgi:geranylgeranyl pyrophosphate synthase